MTPDPWQVFLDTDIGLDVDDAIALTMALRDPDVELRAVTTAYGRSFTGAHDLT